MNRPASSSGHSIDPAPSPTPKSEGNDGSRIVESKGARIEIVEPWRAGRYDPPMQEWLRLPVGDSCPVDASHREWGTINPRGYFLVRRCHVCNATFRGEVGPYTIAEIVGALCGTPRRFVTGNL